MDPDEEGLRRSAGSSSGSRQPALCLLGREKAGVFMIFENFFIILSIENLSTCKTHWAKQGGLQRLLQQG
jgi:hypothetical protein